MVMLCFVFGSAELISSITSPSQAVVFPRQLDQQILSPSKSIGQLDEKTSRILERLTETAKTKRLPPQCQAVFLLMHVSVKKPLIPFGAVKTVDKAIVSSQPIKPNFQRPKRK